jgi:hypothetical protein
MPGERSAFHLWTPPLWKEKTSGVGRAQSDAAICPACDAALSRRLPVWSSRAWSISPKACSKQEDRGG